MVARSWSSSRMQEQTIGAERDAEAIVDLIATAVRWRGFSRWFACLDWVQVKWSKSPRVHAICLSADARSSAFASAWTELLKFP